jgi:hypothetical protein
MCALRVKEKKVGKTKNVGCDGLVCDKWINPIIAPSHPIKLFIVVSLILLLVCENGRRIFI